MAKKMSWKECIEQNIITKIDPDIERSKQMSAMADIRMEFWGRKISERFIALKVEAYYDIIKEIIFALLYKKGFNCSNHLCLISFLREHIKDFDYEIERIDELRQVRNGINYRGFAVKKDFLERNEPEFKNIIKKLKESI